MTAAERLAIIDSELRALEAQREMLIGERERLAVAAKVEDGKHFTPFQKISLFLSLFRCREDVYPRHWENAKDGRKGYAPACGNEWFRGVCEKPRVKCSECFHQAFPPLDEAAARDHLTGKHTIGTYAIRQDNSCVFLAADFDGEGWREDILAYREAARELGIVVALEKSRSGNGGHGWIFFREPVPSLASVETHGNGAGITAGHQRYGEAVLPAASRGLAHCAGFFASGWKHASPYWRCRTEAPGLVGSN